MDDMFFNTDQRNYLPNPIMEIHVHSYFAFIRWYLSYVNDEAQNSWILRLKTGRRLCNKIIYFVRTFAHVTKSLFLQRFVINAVKVDKLSAFRNKVSTVVKSTCKT